MKIEQEIKQSKKFHSNKEKVAVNLLFTYNWYNSKISNFFKAFEGGNLTDLKAKKAILSKDFDAAIAKVSKMKAFEGDMGLRDAALEWFKLYESSLDAEYNHIIELASKPKDKRTAEDKAKLQKLSDELIGKETETDLKFEAAQIAFSKKHNLELKSYEIGQTK